MSADIRNMEDLAFEYIPRLAQALERIADRAGVGGSDIAAHTATQPEPRMTR